MVIENRKKTLRIRKKIVSIQKEKTIKKEIIKKRIKKI